MIEKGSKVKLHFVGTLDDGRIFYSTHIQGGVPMEITIGNVEVLPALEEEIVSMEVGDRKTVTIPAARAYGEYNPELKETVPKSGFPNADQLPLGEYVVFNTEVGPLRVKVESITDDSIVFDYNHELAGQDLTFKIDVLAVMSAAEGCIERENFYREEECGCKKALGHHSHDHDHGHGETCECGHTH